MTRIALIAALVGMALSAGAVASNASVGAGKGKSAKAAIQIVAHNERGECRRGGDRDGDGDC